MGEEPDPANSDEELSPEELALAYVWLDTGEVAPSIASEFSEEERLVLEIADDNAQAFANFEFALRTETDAALKEAREHAELLDKNWDRFHRTSMESICTALELPDTAGASDAIEEIRRLKAISRSVTY